MYIRAYTGFGDPRPAAARSDWRRRWMPDQPAQPLLVFRRIGPFAVNKSVLTPQLKQQVTQVVDFVRSRLNTAKAIGVIRIVGHTDGSGTELHNIGLGNRRTDAVRDELRSQLRDVLYQILIDADESPGKAQPIGDNRTATGQAANRRVDVYVGPPIPKAEPWTKPYDWTVTPPPPRPPKEPKVSKLGGKSVRQFLMDLCRRKVDPKVCKTLVDMTISGGCAGLEALLGRAGATISAEQKKEIERQCKAAADRRV